MTPEIKNKIDSLIASNKVVLFMKGTPHFPRCGFSARTVETVAQYGEPFHAVDVLDDPEIREAIKEYSDWPTIPQLYINGEFVGGCDITMELDAKGELEKLLKAPKAS
ncbi:MAG: Glutaredoxin 4 [Myxococcota bacterium]|nr:Glutaredoxin 4 [Myxococcota bacterium]